MNKVKYYASIINWTGIFIGCMCIYLWPAKAAAQASGEKKETLSPGAYLYAATQKIEQQTKETSPAGGIATIVLTENWLEQQKAYREMLASSFYNLAGTFYAHFNDVENAHKYYTNALKNARNFKHFFERDEALHHLIMLHEEIAAKNLAFNYPKIAETEAQYIYKAITDIAIAGDSVILTIHAGKYDGIDTTAAIEVFTHITPLDTVGHNNLTFMGKARLLSVNNNRITVIIAREPGITYVKGDLLALKAQLPVAWRKLSLRDFLMNELYFTNNYREKLYAYRYLYYFQDAWIEEEIFAQMKGAINEVAEMFKDPEFQKQYSQKATSGIFPDKKIGEALNLTSNESLKLFINFVQKFPARYIANNYKISETYATWVINNTPLSIEDVGPYILGKANALQRQQAAFNFKAQITNDQLIDKWLDEGMQFVNVENIQKANETATLILDAANGTEDPFNAGWGTYLKANINKRMHRDSLAGIELKKALQEFTNAGNKEGISWSESTGKLWEKTRKVKVGIQSGHFLPYTIAQSPNPRYYATGGADWQIKIWDRNLGKEITSITTHTNAVNALTYSSNGRYLLSTSDDSTTCIFNAYNYALLHTFKHKKPQLTAIFTPDNKQIVSGGLDSTINFIDIQSGKIVKTLKRHKGRITGLAFNPLNPDILYSSAADSLVYKWDLQTGEMLRWYKHPGKALSVKVSNDGKFLSVVATDSLLSVWDLTTNKSLKWKVSVHRSGSSNFYGEESFSPDSKYIAFPSSGEEFTIVDLRDYYTRVYKTRVSFNYLEQVSFTNDGLSMFARFFNEGLIRTYNMAGWDIKNNTTLRWKDTRQYGNVIFGVQFSNDDNNLLVVEGAISKIDLRIGQKTALFYASNPVLNPQLILNRDEGLISYFTENDRKFNIYSLEQNKVVRTMKVPGEKLGGLAWSEDSEYCFISSERGDLTTYNTVTGKPVADIKYTNQWTYTLVYDDYRKRLFSVTDNQVIVIDPFAGKVTDSIKIKNINFVLATPQFLFLTTSLGQLIQLDGQTLRTIKVFKLNEEGLPAFQMLLTPDKQHILVMNQARSVMLFNIKNGKPVFVIPDQSLESISLAISHDGKTFATGGLNGVINLYDTMTGKRKNSIYIPYDKGILITDDQQHYMAAKHTLDAIQFSFDNNAYSFDQFDLQLNRPDLVLKQLGRADTSIVNSFYNAYKKRLKRLNVTEQANVLDVHLPLVQLQNKFAVPPVTMLNAYELTVECSDSRYPIQTIQILVNNVPILGVNGLDVSSQHAQKVIRKITIPLSIDNNSIKVFCTNSKGAISLKETFEVISKYPSADPKLYFIGIGVASYKDKTMDLRYSVKDIRDLAKTFKKYYPDVEIDTLIDVKATKENILALKKKLLQTSVNDKVILAVTGHGLLSKSLDFFYGTYDVDFNKPEARGLKYEALEDLLTDIPARQKLMLIDACHSGAVDKEALLAVKNTVQDTPAVSLEKVRAFGARGIEVENKGRLLSASSSFELMQSQFTDLRAGNGAVIISAAGGMEFAFESPKWNNGVFTYCIRTGIEEMLADNNDDQRLTVQELLKYVGTRVEELTNGQQKPTSRRENVDFEWRIR